MKHSSFFPLAALPFVVGSAWAQATDTPHTLEKVVVTGNGGEPTYRAANASTGKSDTPLLETPFAIEVVPRQVLKDQQAINLRDATRNVSGVQANFGYGDLYEAFALRGFETNNTLRNGMRIAGGVGRSSVDMANIDSVEVLKGSAAMIYGRIEPGGLVNVVTRRPQDQAGYAVEQQFGSNRLARTTLDATGPLDENKTVLYRTIYSYFSADSFIDHAPHGRTQFLAPSLTWRPNGDLEVNLDVELRDMHPLTGNGIVAIGNRPANIPITTYIGGDEGDSAHVKRQLVDLNWSYRVNNDWRLRNGFAWVRDNIDFASFFGGSLDESTGDFGIVPWFVKRRSHGLNAFVDLTGHVQAAGAEHTLLVGADHYRLNYGDTGFVNGWAPVDTSNIYSPTYDRPTAGGAHEALLATPPDWTSIGRQQWTGLYLQDQIKLGKVEVLVGGRYDQARARSGSITLEYAAPGSTLADVVPTEAKEHRFSPRLGALYRVTPELSVYGNYVESLGTWGTGLGIASDVNGSPLPAQRSKSYEMGMKAEALGGRMTSTLALFEITKTNMATRDLSSANPQALRAAGEARSRGLEFDLSGEVTRSLSLIASYAYTDARFTQDDSGLQGHRIANVPRHSGSLWAKAQLVPERLSAGVGAFVRSQREGDNENTFQMPGYGTLDAFAAWTSRVGRTRMVAQLNVSNLLNKRYFLNSNVYDASPRFGVMPGQPRTLIGSVRFEI